jgi:two-component system, NarL family, response regulator NreC
MVPIRIVLAEDHALMRRNLLRLLDGEADLNLVAEARDVSAVIRHVEDHVPDVLMLDLHMTGGSSIETVQRLREQVPATEIVMLTMDPSPGFALRAISAGAVGFVIKDNADEELPTAVRCAAQGREYVSSHVVSSS